MRAEGTEPSPCRARPAKPGWGEESRSIRGSQLFHLPLGNPSSPEGGQCHTQCRHPVLFSSCRLALDLTLCWHRCLLNKKLHATNTVLPGTSCLPAFVLLFKFFPLINRVYLYANSRLLHYRATRREKGSCKLYFVGFFLTFFFSQYKGREPRGERQAVGRPLAHLSTRISSCRRFEL